MIVRAQIPHGSEIVTASSNEQSLFGIKLSVEKVISKLAFRGILHEVNSSIWIGLEIFD